MTLQDYFVANAELKNEWVFDLNTEKIEDLKPHANVKVWWRCGKGHMWQATMDSRVYAKRGCPYCAKQLVIPGETDMDTVAPEMAKLWHPTQNGSLKPSDISPGSRKQVWWQCERGHSWKAPPYSIKAGSLCPYCAGKNAIPGETDLATTHPHLISAWSERNTLSPAEVTAGSHKKAWWICEKGHEWESVIASYVIDGCGCPYCAGKRAIPGETDLATLRPDLMNEWDTEKNKLDPREITLGAHDKVWWRCELGHSWQAVVFSRAKETASGCPYCTGRLVLPGFNDLATRKPGLAREWYQPLNGDLKPEDVTLGSNRKVWWQCGYGHVWQAFIYARTKRNGTGCPVCAGAAKRQRSTVVETEMPRKQAKPRVTKKERTASINA